MKKFLIIQTAFIGDVVLATSLVEKLASYFPAASIDFLVRKGNESLLENNPHIRQVLVWNKKQRKLGNLWRMLFRIRKEKYDAVINVQRFAATGLLTAFSKAKTKIGFNKNPLSFLFTNKVKHEISTGGQPVHEIERNTKLIAGITDAIVFKPKLYPSVKDVETVDPFKKAPYLTISPASVWFTKQYPKDKWAEFIQKTDPSYTIYLLGASSDTALADEIIRLAKRSQVINLCGQLTFLQSAALMKDAAMNYVNDSAPLHFASAVNAPVTAIYCSTIPAFGFGPLSDHRYIVETEIELHCRPCGLHGWKACPLGHFKCALTIRDEQLLNSIATPL